MCRRAVVERDEHTAAVQRWLEKVVMGLNICPFARPAGEAGHIRVVTSGASVGRGVLEDLVAEALRLPPQSDEAPIGRATTTVLCCPYVREWQDFRSFQQFYDQELRGGYLLAEQELFIVSFHPKYGDFGPPLQDGDQIEVGEDAAGKPVRATVLDAAAGYGAQGQALAKVKLEDGTETYIQLPASDATENCISRAPRPAFHLLRLGDLERAEDPAGSKGIKERNRRTVAKLGAAAVEDLVRSCG